MLEINKSLKMEKYEFKTYYYFNCDNCGIEFKVEKNNLFRRKTKSCQKCSSYLGLRKINIKPKYQGLLTKIKNSAKKKNLNFNLTLDDILFFTEISNCHYCETVINWNSKNNNRYNLDRKDNSQGYNKDNLVVCCWKCNNTRSNLYTYEEFLLLKEGLINIQKLNKK